MELFLYFRAFLRRTRDVQDFFDEILAQFTVPVEVSYEFIHIPFSPQYVGDDREQYVTSEIGGRVNFMVRQMVVRLAVTSEEEATAIVSKCDKAVYAELRASYFLDREPL